MWSPASEEDILSPLNCHLAVLAGPICPLLPTQPKVPLGNSRSLCNKLTCPFMHMHMCPLGHPYENAEVISSQSLVDGVFISVKPTSAMHHWSSVSQQLLTL